jgi:arylsulfatase A-like enzyme
VDHWYAVGHSGAGGAFGTPEEKEFDLWLDGMNHGVSCEPTPFPLECQIPFRCVSDAQRWIPALQGKPFCLWLTFPEPHNPYQVPEPYFSLFPIATLPPVRASRETLDRKGFVWRWTKRIGQHVFPNYNDLIPRMRADYFGMLRLIDDQVKRFVDFLKAQGLWENTL